VELLANIEMPEDAPGALQAGAVGVGLFRSEFLFMGRQGALPDEEEQFQAYKRAVEGMQGLPVTIRTVDVGADKPLDDAMRDDAHLNPALGCAPSVGVWPTRPCFSPSCAPSCGPLPTGKVHMLVPMLAHASEIRQTLAHIEHARAMLDKQGVAYGPVKLGAMIEIPAAALSPSSCFSSTLTFCPLAPTTSFSTPWPLTGQMSR
jgi:phosphoenolpyruvate-protein phosphotransferase (PTS system enzyme I)